MRKQFFLGFIFLGPKFEEEESYLENTVDLKHCGKDIKDEIDSKESMYNSNNTSSEKYSLTHTHTFCGNIS